MKVKTKFVDSTFVDRNQVFLNFQWKQAVRKLSGVDFNYSYRLHVVLIIRIYFDKNLIYSDKSSKNPDETKNHSRMFPIYWICSTPSIISNTTTNIQLSFVITLSF